MKQILFIFSLLIVTSCNAAPYIGVSTGFISNYFKHADYDLPFLNNKNVRIYPHTGSVFAGLKVANLVKYKSFSLSYELLYSNHYLLTKLDEVSNIDTLQSVDINYSTMYIAWSNLLNVHYSIRVNKDTIEPAYIRFGLGAGFIKAKTKRQSYSYEITYPNTNQSRLGEQVNTENAGYIGFRQMYQAGVCYSRQLRNYGAFDIGVYYDYFPRSFSSHYFRPKGLDERFQSNANTRVNMMMYKVTFYFL
jgi:hypothetical protein